MAKLRLGLFGKTYLDTIVYLECFNHGETNKPRQVHKTLGGIHNIAEADLPLINPVCFEDSQIEAFIISESATSTRSSIVHSGSQGGKPEIKENLIDWLHVAYIDDLCHGEILNDINANFSLDFCTVKDRSDYIKLIKNSSLVFDSRERKYLYKNLNFKAPLVLHDKHGCECIIDGHVVAEGFTDPHDDIHVNGAGDIFAGIFIEKFYTNNLQCAIAETAQETTNHVRKCQNIIF